jgi:Ca2+/Na+ antiporter
MFSFCPADLPAKPCAVYNSAMNKVSNLSVVVNPMWAFIAAVICFGIFFILPSHPKYISLLGWMLFSYAYIFVLIQNYRKKAFILAIGRRVEYEKQPTLYKSIYAILLFAGIFAVVVLVLINFHSR